MSPKEEKTNRVGWENERRRRSLHALNEHPEGGDYGQSRKTV